MSSSILQDIHVEPTDKTREQSTSTDSPKSPHRFLTAIRNSPSILRKKIKHSGKSEQSSEKFIGKSSPPDCQLFHVLYQGNTRVATLQVHEALAAVKKLTFIPGNTLDVENETIEVPSKSGSLSRLSPKSSPRIRRKSPKSPKKNNLKVTRKYLSIDDPNTLDVETIPISTIAYCATDIRHPKIVAFINKDRVGGLICHVLCCETQEKASLIVSCIGKMFESAWEEWKELHPEPVSGRISPSHLGRSSSFHSTYRTTPSTSPSSTSLMVPGTGNQRRRPNSFNVPEDYAMDIAMS